MGEYEYYQRHDLYYSNWRLLIGCRGLVDGAGEGKQQQLGRSAA